VQNVAAKRRRPEGRGRSPSNPSLPHLISEYNGLVSLKKPQHVPSVGEKT
jgi:hypothetical protein